MNCGSLSASRMAARGAAAEPTTPVLPASTSFCAHLLPRERVRPRRSVMNEARLPKLLRMRGDGGDPLIGVRAERDHHAGGIRFAIERTGHAVKERLDDVVTVTEYAGGTDEGRRHDRPRWPAILLRPSAIGTVAGEAQLLIHLIAGFDHRRFCCRERRRPPRPPPPPRPWRPPQDLGSASRSAEHRALVRGLRRLDDRFQIRC